MTRVQSSDAARKLFEQELRRPLRSGEWALEAVGLIGWLLGPLLVAVHWGRLPGRIPAHFNFAGEPDRLGSPSELVVLLAVQAVLYLSLHLIPRLPARLWNLPRLTEENAGRMARGVRRVLAAERIVTAWLFTYIAWQSIRVALGQAAGLGEGFALLVILANLALLGYMVLQLSG